MDGPLTVETWMGLCNAHYYATRDPLGASGDFTTAPEIHQMFGELVGAALADCWLRAGAPADARYAELGPGRGTLAADALRVLAAAGLKAEAELVETSPALRAVQARAVPNARWHDDLLAVGGGPLLLVANEFLDALPIRQWVGEEERRVALDGDRLAFTIDGPIVEDSPARDAAVAAIAGKLRELGGVALLIDYGHVRSAPSDTLQAVRAHRFADVLADPGEQDLTSHVDFEQVAEVARAHGAMVAGPAEQGRWLRALGIDARAKALSARRPARAEEVAIARDRLCGDGQMGRLFKVLALAAPGWPLPEGFA